MKYNPSQVETFFDSLNRNEFLEHHFASTDLWQSFLEWELDFCTEDGCLDDGKLEQASTI